MARTKRSRAGRKRNVTAPRYPNGTPYRHEPARVGPTPEMRARREALFGSRDAQGEVDCALDVLASSVSQIITTKQAQAGRLYALDYLRAMRAAGVSPEARAPRLAERIGGSPRLQPVGEDGKAAWRWRKSRQCVFDCGENVRKVIERVCIDNAMPRGHEIGKLRIGLDALVRLKRL